MQKKNIMDLVASLVRRTPDRVLLGICGAPGAGKSTLAAMIVEEWNKINADEAVLVPMDGYHHSNGELEKRGLLALKGIPETFDAESFLQKLAAIRTFPEQIHLCPRFDRSIEASITDDIKVLARHKLVVTEGNYLLLNSAPWNKIKNVLDEIWFLEVDEEVLFPRLLARHLKSGKSSEAANAKVHSTDLPNARLVTDCRERASRIIKATDLEMSCCTQQLQ